MLDATSLYIKKFTLFCGNDKYNMVLESKCKGALTFTKYVNNFTDSTFENIH